MDQYGVYARRPFGRARGVISDVGRTRYNTSLGKNSKKKALIG